MLGPGAGNQLSLGWQSLKLASRSIRSDPGLGHLLRTGPWLVSRGSCSELELLLSPPWPSGLRSWWPLHGTGPSASSLRGPAWVFFFSLGQFSKVLLKGFLSGKIHLTHICSEPGLHKIGEVMGDPGIPSPGGMAILLHAKLQVGQETRGVITLHCTQNVQPF